MASSGPPVEAGDLVVQTLWAARFNSAMARVDSCSDVAVCSMASRFTCQHKQGPTLCYTLPRSRHFWKMRCTCASAWLRASSGVSLPVAAWANMVEITQVPKISSMAALA
jgi:hypothetical protein